MVLLLKRRPRFKEPKIRGYYLRPRWPRIFGPRGKRPTVYVIARYRADIRRRYDPKANLYGARRRPYTKAEAYAALAPLVLAVAPWQGPLCE